MWETLTGERLFKGETEAETLAKILRDPVVPPSRVADLPPAFDVPLMRALSREAQKRQATARELSLELEKCEGIASPTEVGEWVEALVGPLLTQRELMIAEMESVSSAMRVTASGRPEPDSDSDVSGIPRSIPDMARLPPPSSSSRGRLGVATPTAPMTATATTQLAAPPTGAEEVPSRVTGSRTTGTMSVPVDRKLPIIASLAGVAVLLVIVAVVIAGKAANDSKSDTPAASGAPGASAVDSVGAGSPGLAPSSAPGASATASSSAAGAEPQPPPTTTAAGATATATASTAATATATAASTTTSTWHPSPTRTAATATAKATATAAVTSTNRKNCDPNYTIDEHGHKKYKLECM
jgi:serine/threonine-protein kinase